MVTLAPSLPPANLRATSKTSPTVIKVHWKPVPKPFYVHGILRGYRVFYRPISVSGKPIKATARFNEITVGPSDHSAQLKGLNSFTKYEIKVLAFTDKGDGVKSLSVTAGNPKE